MIFHSPFPDVTIPDVSFAAFVLRHADRLADRPALIDASSGRVLTYGDLVHEVGAVAAGLAARGFGKGSVLGMYAPNCPEYAIALLAVASLGGAATTINHLATADDLTRQLADAGATLLITVPDLLDRARAAATATAVREVVVVGEAPGATPFAELRRPGESFPSPPICRGDVILLPYSSGTTGLPKGVMITHGSAVANLCQSGVPHRVDPGDVVFCLPPFFHMYGSFILGLVLSGGGTLVMMPRFDLAGFLAAVQCHKVTRAYLVPPVILALVNDPIVDDHDLSSLACINSAAAPLGSDLARRCQERLGCSVIQGYGLTETSPATHLVPVTGGRVKPGSVGPLVPNTECRVVDLETGADLGPNQRGELWVRGPQVMKGYLNRPDATAAMIDADGWLRTGDVGYADEDGDFFLVDRLKELIKFRAYQVAPAELEEVLLSHPAVADAAVVPSPDDEAGEVPKAYVVLKDHASAEDLMAFVASRVAPYKKVRRLEFVDQIPKSPTGKILRRLLVERERAAMPVLVG
jgi:acyl-CoA synthetase (AMP-forming)/AMP-acid ligase II